jgi:hypothetical protein
MQRPIWRVSVALAVAMSAVIMACPGGGGGGGGGEDDLFITASPRTINDQGLTSQIEVTATKADGTAGTGSVVLQAVAGRFANGTATETLTLGANGKATATFSCNKADDSRCSGNVRIDGTWNTVTASTTLVVSSTGGGTDGGGGGGTDGGPKPDASLPDGGIAAYVIVIETSKPLLVANTGDQTNVTATVTRTSNNTPAVGVQVNFATTLGSFTPALGAATAQATTDANGKATVTLYVANTTPGTARITATYDEGRGIKDLPFAAVSSMVYQTSASTKALLGLASSGRDTTTPIIFKVTNSNQQPVPNVEVSFEVSGAAGASVTPTATTDNAGIVSTTLRSGDSVGVAIVRAIVTATKNSTPDVSATHPGTPIVGGKPSDKSFFIDCTQKNLGALHANPPPRGNVTTQCEVKLVDRFSNPVGLSTPVQWFAEAGSIDSPSNSKAQTGGQPSADTGKATTIFSTSGGLPYPVTPLAGERVLGDPTDPNTRNPRDMAVTVIAVVAGEEEFADGSGSGSTAGQLNGRWDPGEWFTDLGEPLIDRNDNGVWDSGEVFIDTERIDCANPSAPATKNNKWDGPNGCWDANTQLWRPVIIVYSGPLYTGPDLAEYFELNPAAPHSVPAGGVVDVFFRWSDPYFNRMSPDGASFSVSRSGNRGQAAVVAGDPAAFAYGGFNVQYLVREGTTQPNGTIQVGPLCDTGKPSPAGSTTSPVTTRCVRTLEYTFLRGGNTGTVRLTGGAAPPSPSVSTVDLRANHQFSASPGVQWTATFE